MHKFTINKRTCLRVLLVAYFFPLSLFWFSLSVPPADLPLCGLMFAWAVLGLILARGESRTWRAIWLSALILSILGGALEFVAGKRIAHQHADNSSSKEAILSDPPINLCWGRGKGRNDKSEVFGAA